MVESSEEESGKEEANKESKKKVKRDAAEEMRYLRERILIRANEILALTTFTGRCIEDDIKVIEDTNKEGWYTCGVKCPMCRKPSSKPLQLAFSHRTTASLANFKRHLSKAHIQKTTTGTASLTASSNQPTICQAFNKRQALMDKPSDKQVTEKSADDPAATDAMAENSNHESEGS